MALYFVDYDLRKDRDYPKLYEELAKFKAIRILQSLWCLNHSNTSCKQLREILKKFIDDDDRLCVSQVTDWAARKTLDNPNSLTPRPPKVAVKTAVQAAVKKAAGNTPAKKAK